MKRFLATLAVLSMTAVLAACTQQTEEPAADEAMSEEAAIEVVEPAAEEAAMEATEEAAMEATEEAAE